MGADTPPGEFHGPRVEVGGFLKGKSRHCPPSLRRDTGGQSKVKQVCHPLCPVASPQPTGPETQGTPVLQAGVVPSAFH